MKTFQVFSFRVSHQKRVIHTCAKTLNHPCVHFGVNDGAGDNFLEEG